MRPRDILELQRLRPFPGLRIHVSDGQSYDVRHPEMMAVTQTMVHVFLPPEVDGVLTRTVYCDPVHITTIERLDENKRPVPRRRRKS